MQNFEKKIYDELLKKEYWDLAYDRMIDKPFSNVLFDSLFILKESPVEKDKIAKQLINGNYSWSIPEKLELAKAGTTKKRIVYMYNEVDRYVLGVLYRALSNIFKNEVAENCYSYKRGVNTAQAIREIGKTDFSKQYGLKLDIHAYFNSVKREHLNFCLTELFGNTTGIRKTMDSLFNNDIVLFKGKEINEYKSLIPGCALGSFFANYCLREIDYHFQEQGVIYARYSDDIIFFADTKEEIDYNLTYLLGKISEYGLEVNEKKYTHFNPNEVIVFLGLALSSDGIDISNHAKNKIKKTIKRWIKKGRREIEIDGLPFEIVAEKIIHRFNYRLYKCFIEDARKFGWGYYAFRYITTADSIIEIDYYLKDRLRFLRTGKNNKANHKAITDEELNKLGLVSTYEMYKLFKYDFEYYCEVVSLM